MAVAPVRYIRSHGALRGLAALLVVAYHLQFGAPHHLAIETATPFFERCYLLVDLFFVLSGFVISLTSDADRTSPFDAGETRDFYVTRLARIYPLHLFCLCYIVVYTLGFAAFVQWHHHRDWHGHWLDPVRLDPRAAWSLIEEFFLVQAWIPGAPYWNIPSWSISAELFAYAVFPAIVALRSRLSRVARYLLLLFPLVFYVSVWRDAGSLDIIAGVAPFRCLSGFIVGMALFDLRASVAGWTTQTLAAWQIAAVAGAIAVLAVRVPDPLAIPPFAVLVVTTWQDRGPVPAMVCNQFLSWTGELSYSIYLNHVCLIAIILPVWYTLAMRSGLPVDAARIVMIVTSFAITLAVSQWTYTQVERSSRRYLRRYLSRSPRSLTARAAPKTAPTHHSGARP